MNCAMAEYCSQTYYLCSVVSWRVDITRQSGSWKFENLFCDTEVRLFVQVVKMALSQDWWCWTPSFMAYWAPSDVTGINVSCNLLPGTVIVSCSYITEGSILFTGYSCYYTCWLGWWWLITSFQAFLKFQFFDPFLHTLSDQKWQWEGLGMKQATSSHFQTKRHCCNPSS